MNGLDLKKFKKVSSDQKSTILKHADGHELKIAHASLSDKNRKALEALPSNAPKVKMMKDGGPSSSDSSDDESKAYPVEQEGAPKQAPVVINVGGAQQQPQQQQAPVSVLPQTPEAPAAQPEQDNSQFSVTPVGQDQVQPQQEAPAEPSQGLADAAREPAVAGAPSQEGTQEEVPPADTEQSLVGSQPGAVPLDTGVKTYQDAYQAEKQKMLPQFAKEDVHFAQDLRNGHITPKTYHDLFAEKSTLGKIGMIFGMMIGGGGAGLSHQPNALLGMMNKEIENDLEAQKQNKSNAQNFIKINQQGFLNDAQIKKMQQEGKLTEQQARGMMQTNAIQADTFARMQMNRTALHDLVLQTQKMPPGPQKQQAEQLLAGLSTAVDAQNFQLMDVAASKGALMKQLGSGDNTTFLRMNGMKDLAENIEKKTVPGVGRASVDVPQQTRDKLLAHQQYDEAARKYIAYSDKYKNNFMNLNLKERQKIANTGAALAADLQTKARLRNEGGVWKAGEQEFIESIAPSNPTAWSSSFNAIPKVQQTIRNNYDDFNNLSKSVGIQGTSNVSHAPAKNPMEGRTATNPKTGQKLINRNGKWGPYGG